MNCIRALATASMASLVLSMSISSAISAVIIKVRSGPGSNYPVAYTVTSGSLPDVECITHDASGNGWYQLKDGNYVLVGAVLVTGDTPECPTAG